VNEITEMKSGDTIMPPIRSSFVPPSGVECFGDSLPPSSLLELATLWTQVMVMVMGTDMRNMKRNINLSAEQYENCV